MINPKTIQKWRKRATVEGLKSRPKEPHTTVPSEEEEAIIIASAPAVPRDFETAGCGGRQTVEWGRLRADASGSPGLLIVRMPAKTQVSRPH